MDRHRKAIFLALTAILMWSTVAVPFKYGLQYFHFVHFLFITVSIAVFISFFNLVIKNKLKSLQSLNKRDWILGVFGGFLNPFLYYLMLFKAYSLLPAQIAQSLNYTWPIMLVILSVPILGQKLRLISVLTLFLGFSGVYLIASEGQLWPLVPSEPFGVILAILSSVVWALFWLLNTRSKIDASMNLFINFSSAWIMTLPFVFFFSFEYSVPDLAWVAVGYSGVFEMGLSFIVWLAAMKMASRTDQISNFVFLSPFLSLFFIYLILNEKIYPTTIVGLVIIVSSIIIKQYIDHRIKLK